MLVLVEPASAQEIACETNDISISSERASEGAYRLRVTNVSDSSIVSIDGVTSVPESIVASDGQAVYSWTVGKLPVGESALAQDAQGQDLVIHIGEGAEGERKAIEDNSQASNIAHSKKKNGTPDKLSTTGTPVVGLICLAAGLVMCGVSIRRQGGHLFVRRTVAGIGVVAMIVGMPSMATEAQAAQKSCESAGLSSSIESSGQQYALISDVRINYGDEAEPEEYSSLAYAKVMGSGWNLGNSFDSVGTDLSEPDQGEVSWGNPQVTKELIRSVKSKGFTSIRIPMTAYRRYTEVVDAATGTTKTVLDEQWLERYREVVDWAVDEGLHVMIDIHHDSWLWAKNWNGDTNAAEYIRFSDLWKQMASYFADEPELVSFETLNEPQFSQGDAQEKLNALNKAAYDIIRATPGNEQRMIVIPTVETAHGDDRLKATRDFIQKDLHNDPYVMATVHYYSEWVYSANLGITGFDEDLYGGSQPYNPRNSMENFFQRVNAVFTTSGIGTVIGEYGLLAYDSASDNALQAGEEQKYYEYMGHMAREHGIAAMFWDNGSGIDRNDAGYSWKKPLAGDVIQASTTGRSSYATGLDTVYIENRPDADISIPLALNGNSFIGIDGLTEGGEYTYDSQQSAVVLKADYLASVFDARKGNGLLADLTLRFSAGAPWHEYVMKSGVPTVDADRLAAGTRENGLDIALDFAGNEFKSITTYQNGNKVGPNSGWWKYLQNGSAVVVHDNTADHSLGSVTLTPSFFADATVQDGQITLEITFQSGKILELTVEISNGVARVQTTI